MNKKYSIHSLLFLLPALIALQGCNTEDIAGEQAAPGNILSLQVDGQPFTSSDAEDAGTRTTDNGYGTTFDTGDAIGIFGLKPDGTTLYVNNQKAVRKSDGTWDVEKIPYADGVTYFAYYPYREEIKGKKSTDEIVSAFTLSINQGTKEAYQAQDILVATGSVNTTDKTLSLSFTHARSMIELKLPDGTQNVDFETPVPYNVGNNVYRYLAVPGSSVSIKGGYKYKDFWVDMSATTSITAPDAGKYKKVTMKNNCIYDISMEMPYITGNGTYIITGSRSGGNNRIVIESTGSPTIILVNMQLLDAWGFEIEKGSPTFILKGTNEITHGRNYMGGIQAFREATFTIKGDGSLDSGTGFGSEKGNILITDNATIKSTAIITDSGNITIENSTVTTILNSEQPTGIHTDSGNITIENSTVTAISNRSYQTGLGTKNGGNITIENSTVTAEGLQGGAGIGSLNSNATCGNITISNSTITATGTQNRESQIDFTGAAIGCCSRTAVQPSLTSYSTCGNITITLKEGQSKENFLQGCSAPSGSSGSLEVIGKSRENDTCGEIKWYNHDGTPVNQ